MNQDWKKIMVSFFNDEITKIEIDGIEVNNLEDEL